MISAAKRLLAVILASLCLHGAYPGSPLGKLFTVPFFQEREETEQERVYAGSRLVNRPVTVEYTPPPEPVLPPEPVKKDYWGNCHTDTFFYRALLSDDQRLCYDAIFDAVKSLRREVTMPALISWDDFCTVVDAFFNDNPGLYYSDIYNCDGFVDNQDRVTRIEINYDSRLVTSYSGFIASAKAVLNRAVECGSDVEREIFIHDTLIKSVYFRENEYDQIAYSAVVQGASVCSGYSAAFQYYMDMLASPCVFVYSDDHAWNMVVLDGEYYNVDVMWDDNDDGFIYYDFFNLSDRYISMLERTLGEESGYVHVRNDLSALIPAAECMDMSYFELAGGGVWNLTDEDGTAYTVPDVSPGYYWTDPFREGRKLGDWDFDWESGMFFFEDAEYGDVYYYDIFADVYWCYDEDGVKYRYDERTGDWISSAAAA